MLEDIGSAAGLNNVADMQVDMQVSQNCAFYSLKGYVAESNPFIVNSTDIYIAAGGDILDACGQPFNVTVTQVQQAHRYA